MKASEVEVGGTYTASVSGHVQKVRITGLAPTKGWLAVNTATGRAVRIKSPQRLRSRVAGPGPEVAPEATPAPEAANGTDVDPRVAGERPPCPVCGDKTPVPIRGGGYHCISCRHKFDPTGAIEIVRVEVKPGDVPVPAHELTNGAVTRDLVTPAGEPCDSAGNPLQKLYGQEAAPAQAGTPGADAPPAEDETQMAKKAKKERKPKAERKPRAPKAPKEPKAKKERKMSGLDYAHKVLKAEGPLGSDAIAAKAVEAGWVTNGKTPGRTLDAAMRREIAEKKGESRFRLAGRGSFATA